jgi:hypothetical protein
MSGGGDTGRFAAAPTTVALAAHPGPIRTATDRHGERARTGAPIVAMHRASRLRAGFTGTDRV